MSDLVPTTFSSWEAVHDFLTGADYHHVAVIRKAAIPDPASQGALRSLGLPRGQSADFRFPPDAACQGLHVQDFGDTWHAHLDIVHPACDLMGHVRADAPRFGAYVATAALGAVAGGTFAGRRGALIGAVGGVLLSLTVDMAASCMSSHTPQKLPPKEGGNS